MWGHGGKETLKMGERGSRVWKMGNGKTGKNGEMGKWENGK